MAPSSGCVGTSWPVYRQPRPQQEGSNALLVCSGTLRR